MKIKRSAIVFSALAMLSGGLSQAAGPGGVWLSGSIPLSSAERESLLFMREEEKMARDVYLNAYQRWQSPIFYNISQSEQKHMDAVGGRIDFYDLTDPVSDDTVGVFTNSALAALYQELELNAEASLLDALKTSALIEEVDIEDLEAVLAETSHPDVVRVYQNLLRGSRNHLRAFVRQIEAMGTTYEAQVMDQESLDAIVDQPMERSGRSRQERR